MKLVLVFVLVILTATIVSPIQAIKLVCPSLPEGTVGTCDERCSGDASCPGIQKCCSHGCGHSCQNPVKPGKCPAFKPDLVTICLVECNGDASCPGNQKCCSFGCHVRCSAPEAKPERKCDKGQPYKDNGIEIFCGRGTGSQTCPEGYTCVIDPLDRFAVCCRG